MQYSVSESIVVHLTDCNYTRAESHAFGAEAFLREKFEQLLDDWQQNRHIFRLKADVYALLCDLAALGKTARGCPVGRLSFLHREPLL